MGIGDVPDSRKGKKWENLAKWKETLRVCVFFPTVKRAYYHLFGFFGVALYNTIKNFKRRHRCAAEMAK